jgi:mRNA interferase RelE/StbE
MDSYSLRYKPSVEKDLARLPRSVFSRVLQRIENLAAEPFSRGIIKLEGSEGLYRARVGSYRIVYAVDDSARCVTIHYVRHRRDAYRN